MNIYAFIPSRYQSSRFPGKPLALIDGKPMIQRVYECAKNCPEISDVFIATDDRRISECIEGFKGNAIMTSTTHVSGTDRISEAAKKAGINSDDIVVNIQGDQPAFAAPIIPLLVNPLIEDVTIPMSTLKFRITDPKDIQNPNNVKVITDFMDFAIYFSRHPIPYVRDQKMTYEYFKHLGFYAFRMDSLIKFTNLPEGRLESAEKLEQLRALENGMKIKVLQTTHNSSEVDVPDDIQKIEGILKQRHQSGQTLMAS